MPYCPVCKDEFLAGVAVCPDCNVALVDALPPSPKAGPAADITDVTVAVFNGEAEAMLWADILRQEGILCVLVPLSAGAGAWGNSSMMPHQLRVRSQDVERARELLPELG